MIRSITVTNDKGESLKMELTRPEESGFIVKHVDGLQPPKANINLTKTTSKAGGIFNSVNVDERNIVIQLIFVDSASESIEDIRHKSYRYFPHGKNVRLVVETDTRTVETYGRVEDNDVSIFDQQEGTQISIVCPDAYLHASGTTGTQITSFHSVEPTFEFPFINESVTDPLLIMSNLIISTERVILYSGDVNVGMTITIRAVGEARNVTFHNMVTRESLRLNTDRLEAFTGQGVQAGDEITISSVIEHKGATLLRNGVTTNILNCIDKDSDWFELTTGDNIFAYEAEYGAENLYISTTNQILYTGV